MTTSELLRNPTREMTNSALMTKAADELDTLKDLLRKLEWSSIDHLGSPCCPLCKRLQVHTPDCELAKALQTHPPVTL